MIDLRTCPDCGEFIVWNAKEKVYHHKEVPAKTELNGNKIYDKSLCYYRENSDGERVWDNKLQIKLSNSKKFREEVQNEF